MGWTYIGKASGHNENAGTTLDCASTLDVQAGDLLVCGFRWYNADTTSSVADTDGDNVFTLRDRQDNGLGGSTRVGYKISATAKTGATFRLTHGSASAAYRAFIVFQFRPDSGDTVTLDAAGPAGPTNNANPTSGTISTTGDDEVVVCITNTNNWGYPRSNPEIGGVAALELTEENNHTGEQMIAMYYRIFAATQTDIVGEDTISSSNTWLANILAFKAVASGGTTVAVPVLSGEGVHSAVFGGQVIRG